MKKPKAFLGQFESFYSLQIERNKHPVEETFGRKINPPKPPVALAR